MSNLPSILHQHNEVLIFVNGRRNCSIIVVSFLLGDFTVFVDITEAFQECVEDLLWGLLASNDLRVVVAVVHTFEIIFGDEARPIFVELLEGLVDDFLSLGTEPSSDADEEFIEVDGSVLVSVQGFVKSFGFLIRQRAPRIVEASKEFLAAHLLIAVIIVGLESASQTSDCS